MGVAVGEFDKMEEVTNNTLDKKYEKIFDFQLIWQLEDSLYKNLGTNFKDGNWQKDLKLAELVKLLGGYDGTLAENSHTKLNEKMKDTFAADMWAKGGLWLADNICEGGVDIARAIGTMVTPAQEAKCKSACDSAYGAVVCDA